MASGCPQPDKNEILIVKMEDIVYKTCDYNKYINTEEEFNSRHIKMYKEGSNGFFIF